MYLFLAIPNFCGSTLMHSLLETVPEVVPLTVPDERVRISKDFVEGNVCAVRGGYYNLHGPHSMEANMEPVYSNPKNYNWPLIKMAWHENWANTNPYGTILMQKTPADIFRIRSMLPHFPDCKWIISVRNPYHYVESIYRKATFFMEPWRQLDQICHHVLRTMEIQAENKELLGDDAYGMTLEGFTNHPGYHCQKLGDWIPALRQIDLGATLMIKGRKVESLQDDRTPYMRRFFEDVPQVLDHINEFFIPKECILNHWGYELELTPERLIA